MSDWKNYGITTIIKKEDLPKTEEERAIRLGEFYFKKKMQWLQSLSSYLENFLEHEGLAAKEVKNETTQSHGQEAIADEQEREDAECATADLDIPEWDKNEGHEGEETGRFE